MFGAEPIQAKAGGTIRPSRFVKVSTAADFTILEADANEFVVGVSMENTRDAPLDGASTDLASSGDPCEYYGEGRIAPVLVGSGGVTRGAEVKSDADGQAVLAATTGTTKQNIGGVALETASEGELARILIKIRSEYPALA